MKTLHKKSVMCLVLMLLFFHAASAKVYLVSVGISDYPGEKNDLTLPVADAQTITWLYTKSQDAVYTQLLNEKATCDKIVAAMNKVYSMAGENDAVVLFYSGHGYPGGLYVYDGRLEFSKIRKSMALSKSHRKIIFSDSCFSGSIRTTGQESNSQTESSSAQKSDVLLFLSSRSDETSIESPQMKNGFFTTYLQKGLRGGADVNKDRIITAREIFDYVSSGVVSISDGKQHPVMWGNFPDNMVIMNWK